MTGAALSEQQTVILLRMIGTADGEASLTVPDFEDVATVDVDRREWARKPMLALERLGLVQRGPVIARSRTLTWRITLKGIEAVFDLRAGGAGA